MEKKEMEMRRASNSNQPQLSQGWNGVLLLSVNAGSERVVNESRGSSVQAFSWELFVGSPKLIRP